MVRTHWLVALLATAFIAGGMVSCSNEIDPATGEIWDEGGDFGNELGSLASALSLTSGDSCCTKLLALLAVSRAALRASRWLPLPDYLIRKYRYL